MTTAAVDLAGDDVVPEVRRARAAEEDVAARDHNAVGAELLKIVMREPSCMPLKVMVNAVTTTFDTSTIVWK
ncbi:MAG: hypothetical protein U0326_40055 [Polyangiales bacterium]